MDELQREIIDERKLRIAKASQRSDVSSFGFLGLCAGLTVGASGWIPLNAPIRSERNEFADFFFFEGFGPPMLNNAELVVRVPQTSTPKFREQELEWRRAHAAELREYENEWVVLEGEQIIAHNSNAAQAIRQAKLEGIRTPYIFFVEPESDDSVRIGL